MVKRQFLSSHCYTIQCIPIHQKIKDPPAYKSSRKETIFGQSMSLKICVEKMEESFNKILPWRSE